MARAAKICPHVDRDGSSCTNVQPCAAHPRKPWGDSRRRERSTLSGSRQQRRARYVISRDDTICHVCGNPGADQADHIIALAAGGADTVANMAAIHSDPCHRLKTERESAAAR